jgi:molybdate transport system ATP-binding protein
MENDIIQIDVEKELISTNGRLSLSIKTDLNMGELVVLFGESGAGKTTLLRMLSGLTKPDRGFIKVGKKIWLDTDDKIDLTPQQRNIGFMFQDYALFQNMTVLENILFAQQKKDKKEAKELLDKFGINEFADRKPTKLSGGQKHA